MPVRDTDESILGWDETLFRNERVLEVDYVPEVVRHRETQLRGLQHALRPAVRGSRPLNVLARGPPGTGKTTAIEHLFSELEDRSGVLPVRVNCQMDTTRYSVFSRVFDGVLNYQPPTSGVSFSTVFEKIASEIVREEQVLVVALDDINYLFYENEASDTLYSLLRSHEAYSGAKIGVITVSSDMELDVVGELDQRVQSVYRPEEVFFPAYDEIEVREILDDRVQAAFYDDAVNPEAIERVASLTTNSGDLRVGIDLLRRAGLKAESDARLTVTVDDVEDAYEKSVAVHFSRRLENLSDDETALVRIIAERTGSQAGEVFEAFHEETDLQYTQFSSYINKLDRSGLIHAEFDGTGDRGRSRNLTTAYEPELVLDEIKD